MPSPTERPVQVETGFADEVGHHFIHHDGTVIGQWASRRGCARDGSPVRTGLVTLAKDLGRELLEFGSRLFHFLLEPVGTPQLDAIYCSNQQNRPVQPSHGL